MSKTRFNAPIVSTAHRPHSWVADRILKWVPTESHCPRNEHGQFVSISELELEQISTVTCQAWATSTRETYGTGLLIYHVFCDMQDVPDTQRAPASELLILTFISALAGSYSSSTINNYLCYEAALTGAGQLAPPSSTRPKHDPITINLLMQIEVLLNISQTEDATIWVCACVAFFSLAQLGELTVKTQKSYKASEHPSRQSVHIVKHRDGSIVHSIHLPITKTSPKGKDISFAKQSSGRVDPWEALDNHFAVNNLKDSSHLFAYRKQPSNTIVPLTRNAMLRRLRAIAPKLEPSVAKIAGHSFRIGGTLEYLLRGLSFETVKAIGLWKSNAFTLYLCKHAQILAPYLQDKDKLLERFLQLTIQLPPVR
ncbi:uncharacterized protein TRAVEDRAFT_36956 [Trametes versicolor FP-101664 SS1]|uniref:uncharacterized protein n=1 Tax=Trametes versicolor (strain FP-101664) TaxID=717944 RepID=UPI000462125A|nr:uncharacterized protein TRAVEDRAFT_36956 [Trametes versicolor FP-101664 SS1]EIW59637.1 hypothetical protein TRAVEDRAFT_36956 [Trametes versicolor FP-101664 SS1]